MLRFRWLVLVVCLVYSMSFVTPVSTADDLIKNGDFSQGTAQSLDGWKIEYSPGGPGVLYASPYHGSTPSLGWAGTGDMSYSQCVDISGLSGSVAFEGWTTREGSYEPSSGFISLTRYDETDCSGDSTPIELGVGSETPGYWTPLSADIELPSLPRETYRSLKVLVYAAPTEHVYFDDIHALTSPTVVTIDHLTAHPGWPPVVALMVGVAVYESWRRRRVG